MANCVHIFNSVDIYFILYFMILVFHFFLSVTVITVPFILF